MSDNCKQCGETLERRPGVKNFCLECQQERRRAWHRDKRSLVWDEAGGIRQVQCEHCNKEFAYRHFPTSRERRFCCMRCVYADRVGRSPDWWCYPRKAVPTRELPSDEQQLPKQSLDGVEPTDWDDAGVLRLLGAVFGEAWLRENIAELLSPQLAPHGRPDYDLSSRIGNGLQ